MAVLDRSVISDQYSVLESLPIPEAQETLTWCTNIFIAASLDEIRESLTNYPAIEIDYTFELTPDTRLFVQKLQEQAKTEWVIPYLPHLTYATVERGVLTNVAGHGSPAKYYPYLDRCFIFDNYNLVYCNCTTTTGTGEGLTVTAPTTLPNFVPPVFICPAFVAYISPGFNYRDEGPFKYGGELNLLFRLTAEAERAMTYKVDDFGFLDAIQSPMQTTGNRRQKNFYPKPAPAYAYRPVAHEPAQTEMVDATYFLCYNHEERHDYFFRGAMMKRLGSLMHDTYVETGKQHRLVDDQLTINYHQGWAEGKAKMRLVTS